MEESFRVFILEGLPAQSVSQHGLLVWHTRHVQFIGLASLVEKTPNNNEYGAVIGYSIPY